MPRYTDPTGVQHTCPLIDSVIDVLKKFDPDDEEDAIRMMEDIRNANSRLRDFGQDQYRQVCNLESERDDVQDELDRLKRDYENLQSEYNELERRYENA